MPTALITCLHLQRGFAELRPEYEELGVDALLPEVDGQQLDAGAMAELVAGADAVIAGDDVIDAGVLEAGKAAGLRAVIKWGVGTNAIDLHAAARLGLPVFNTPGVFGEEVADLAMSHLLMLARQPHLMHESVLHGGWRQVQGHSLRGMTAGIVGIGAIGGAIARRAAAFGMEVRGCDVRPVDPSEHGVPGLEQVDLEVLCATSDVVFVAAGLTPRSNGLLSRDAFARMRPGAFVINVSRGALIDHAALVGALRDDTVAGAGLDVFADEPLPADDPLREFADRCVFTTHSGSNTHEAVARINRLTTDILFDVLGVRKLNGYVPNRVA